MKMKIRIVLWSMAVLLLGSCAGNRKTASNSAAKNIYDYSNQPFHPLLTFWNKDKDSTIIFIRFNSKEFLFARQHANSGFVAYAHISAEARLTDATHAVVDTFNVTIRDDGDMNKPHYFLARIPLYLKDGRDYMVTVSMTDVLRQAKIVDEKYIQKSQASAPENVVAEYPENGSPIFNPYFTDNITLALKAQNSNTKKLEERIFQRDFPLPPPPFASYKAHPLNNIPDSASYLFPDTAGIYRTNLSQSGIYQFSTDTSSYEAYTLFRFPPPFPKVSSVESLLLPLRYLLSGDEYDRIRKSPDVRKAIEDFWLSVADNNKDKARELIKAYYDRVETANRLFSSYVEGWRTDRGMVYIIFGPPSSVYKHPNDESWLYGEENIPGTLNFDFSRTINPFSDNNYQMRRDQIYKPAWYHMVDLWRTGRYNMN